MSNFRIELTNGQITNQDEYVVSYRLFNIPAWLMTEEEYSKYDDERTCIHLRGNRFLILTSPETEGKVIFLDNLTSIKKQHVIRLWPLTTEKKNTTGTLNVTVPKLGLETFSKNIDELVRLINNETVYRTEKIKLEESTKEILLKMEG